MAYQKRFKYTIIDDNNLKQELLEILENLGTISKAKARQLVYYPVPMSLIRWSNYLTPAQAEKYLVPFEEETNISDSDMGI